MSQSSMRSVGVGRGLVLYLLYQCIAMFISFYRIESVPSRQHNSKHTRAQNTKMRGPAIHAAKPRTVESASPLQHAHLARGAFRR